MSIAPNNTGSQEKSDARTPAHGGQAVRNPKAARNQGVPRILHEVLLECGASSHRFRISLR